jgi:RNA polymerase sigma factor (sigma-70 family)
MGAGQASSCVDALGDAPARFCEAQYGRLVGALTVYTGDRDLAQDLAQEALVRACVHWRRVSRMAAPGAWLHRVALNLANSNWSRRQAEERARARVAAERPGPARDGNDALFVRSAIVGLPVRQRTALVLRYYADLPVREVAALMHCRSGTVKALTHQAIASLRQQLGAERLEEARDDG